MLPRWASALLVAAAMSGCIQSADPPTQGLPDDGRTTLDISVIDALTGDPVAQALLELRVAGVGTVRKAADADGLATFTIRPAASCTLLAARLGYIDMQGRLDCRQDQRYRVALRPETDEPQASSSSTTSKRPPPSPPPNPSQSQQANATNGTSAAPPAKPPADYVPHVVVGVPDSGFNVYHQVYRRPDLTVHPCTYVQDYPCDIPALNLTLDAPSWQAAFEADRAKWEAIRPGDRYWIPGTNIIGAICSQPYRGSTVGSTDPTATTPDLCILDDTNMHGTGTSSSVLSENPDALLVVVEGNSGGAAELLDDTYPIDVVSYSWGAAVPLVGLGLLAEGGHGPFYVAASGNEGAFPVVLDGPKSHPDVINVGGADAATRTEPGYSSWKTADFVSEYCRPTAQTRVLEGDRPNYCGTSFAAPTFAGALSRIILELRMASGYTGTIRDGFVDPLLGVSKAEVRDALNRTASYAPQSPFPAGSHNVPLLTAAPFYQWGWGYVARNDVPATLACILDAGTCPSKDQLTTTYMQALWTYRTTTTGG